MYFFLFFNFSIGPIVCRRNSLSCLTWWIYLQFIFAFFMHIWEKLISWTLKLVHAFSFSNLNTSVILLEKKKFSYIMWASHFGRNRNKLSISWWLTTEVQVSQNVGLRIAGSRTLLQCLNLENIWALRPRLKLPFKFIFYIYLLIVVGWLLMVC